jgi:hypothetical protein
MGFAYERFWGEPPSFVILYRDGMYLMLKQVDDPKHVVPHWTVSDKLWDAYFWGPIALQWGRGVIKFRKVQIKEL